ncbi:hypothetical protein [Chitinophaga sp. MM2321]|uniref:hypothetical protein n=1 Tax=Chitinophaga sp. MM2321 TaxID=3137178 RepID=UPI0032D57735
MKKWFLGGALFILSDTLFIAHCYAQLSLGAQLRTRTELRDGQGTPLPRGAGPALFTSQRSRLFGTFSTYRIKLGLTVQDTRVWGQDASTINRTTTQDTDITAMRKQFGTEADLTATYALTKMIAFEAGYSHFWNTATLTSPTVKNITDASSNSNWAYLMISIRPEILIK